MLKNRVPNIDKAVISVHCHNDLGLAVANSLAAFRPARGRSSARSTASASAPATRRWKRSSWRCAPAHDLMPYDTGIVTEDIMRASRLVSTITGFTVQPNKAIVGANAFAHEFGIHQDGMLKNAQTYEIMTPESVGLTKSSLVMGKHSGRHAFKEKLKDLGYELGDNAFEDAFRRFKDLADKKKQVFDEDIIALVDDEVLRGNDRIKFVSLQVVCGSKGPQTAELELEVDGEVQPHQANGRRAGRCRLQRDQDLFPHEAMLQLFQVHAVTEGTDAQAEVTVRLEERPQA